MAKGSAEVTAKSCSQFVKSRQLLRSTNREAFIAKAYIARIIENALRYFRYVVDIARIKVMQEGIELNVVGCFAPDAVGKSVVNSGALEVKQALQHGAQVTNESDYKHPLVARLFDDIAMFNVAN